MRLSEFIRRNAEEILVEWEEFARSLPRGGSMDVAALRDHAAEMLEVIAADLDTPQSGPQELDKSRGRSDSGDDTPDTAAQSHGAGRAGSGFSVGHMVAEFRALRASVIRIWMRQRGAAAETDLEDMVRFNESIDQAIAESITRYTSEVAETKDRFLAILGHDLRAPIGSIMTSSDFLLETADVPETQRTLLAQIRTTSRRMHRLVEDLLDFTRTRFGSGIPIVRREADLAAIVNEAAAEIGSAHPRAEIRVHARGDLRGRWDTERLMQMLTNLITNAVQHGHKGAPISVEASGAADRVEVAVHSEGPTIPEHEIRRIFMAMKLAAADSGRDSRRLGLGLYIVDRIVAAHGGSVAVTSSEERTTFRATLPRYE